MCAWTWVPTAFIVFSFYADRPSDSQVLNVSRHWFWTPKIQQLTQDGVEFLQMTRSPKHQTAQGSPVLQIPRNSNIMMLWVQHLESHVVGSCTQPWKFWIPWTSLRLESTGVDVCESLNGKCITASESSDLFVSSVRGKLFYSSFLSRCAVRCRGLLSRVVPSYCCFWLAACLLLAGSCWYVANGKPTKSIWIANETLIDSY